jgi:AbiU2
MTGALEEKYKSVLGDDFGVIYVRLLLDFLDLQRQWDLYYNLFKQNESRYKVLNASEPLAFKEIQRSMMHSIVSGISRFADPVEPKMKSKKRKVRKNLSLQSLQLEPLLTERPDLVDNFRLAFVPIKPWRDWKVAHRDLETAISTPAELPNIKFDEFSLAIEGICKILISVHERHIDSSLILRMPAADRFGVTLLHTLYYGELFRQQRKDRILRSEFPDSDRQPKLG